MIISYIIPGSALIVSGEFMEFFSKSGDDFEATVTDSQSRSTSQNDALLKKMHYSSSMSIFNEEKTTKMPIEYMDQIWLSSLGRDQRILS